MDVELGKHRCLCQAIVTLQGRLTGCLSKPGTGGTFPHLRKGTLQGSAAHVMLSVSRGSGPLGPGTGRDARSVHSCSALDWTVRPGH